MNLRCIGLKISFFAFFCSGLCYSQTISFDTVGFYRHLSADHLWKEQIAFNRDLQKVFISKPLVMDSLRLSMAVTYLQLHLPDSCHRVLSNISTCCFDKRNNQRYLSMLLVNKEYKKIGELISSKSLEMDDRYAKDLSLSLMVLNREPDSMDKMQSENRLSPLMSNMEERYLQTPGHSPFKAGLYSALIPGLGKYYLGYKRQAAISFVANLLLASQAVESYLKAGVASPRFIITTSVFSVFYVGNIWGSYLMAKKQRRDYLKQLDNEIFDYHTFYVTGTHH